MDWTPDAISEAMNRMGIPAVILGVIIYLAIKHGKRINDFLDAATECNESNAKSIAALSAAAALSQGSHLKTHEALQHACHAARAAINHTADIELARKVLPHLDAIERALR